MPPSRHDPWLLRELHCVLAGQRSVLPVDVRFGRIRQRGCGVLPVRVVPRRSIREHAVRGHSADNLLQLQQVRAGYYLAQKCNVSQNAVCLPCTKFLAGSFMISNCTNTSDAVFQACSMCPSGEYASTPCNATADAICSACATCSVNPPTYAAVQCGGTQDTVCAACSFVNPPGTYQLAACTTSTNTQYTNCTTGLCPSGQWRVPCGFFTDSFCYDCLCPDAGMFITQNCTANANQVCAYCQPNSFCPTGQYFTYPQTCSQLYFNPVCVNCTPSCLGTTRPCNAVITMTSSAPCATHAAMACISFPTLWNLR